VADGPLLIFAAGGGAAPFTIPLANDQRCIPTTITATWDGTSAAADFLPCVSYYSPTGVLLGRYGVDAGAVTAGSSVEATYAPFLGQKAAAPTPAASGAPNIATLWRSQSNNADTPQAVTAGGSVAIQFPHQSLPSDGSVSWNAGTPYFLVWNVQAFALEMLYVQFDDATYTRAAFGGTNSRILFANIPTFANTGSLADSPVTADPMWNVEIKPNAHVANDTVSTGAYNGDAVQRHVVEAWWVVYFWPVTGYGGGIPGWPA
jgi:hypothetical protein